MSTTQITWKTNAWKSPEMVAGYARNVADMSGANLMKNRVETELFQKYVHGKNVLDVGIGTGRASIPLAKLGYNLTGVDSSQAMLQKCRELAAGSAMELIEGDVAALPLRDELFDTVMALNTIAHFPHWQQIVQEWARVLRPGGRMIFDMFSMDHDIAYARATGRTDAWGVEHFAAPSVEAYYLRLKVGDLIESLGPFGLRVEAIVPYSVLCGTKGFNRFFEESALSGFAWDRLLSWVGVDPRLFDFLTFLEQDLVGNLTSNAGCRYMAVITKVPDEGENARWLEKNAALNAQLQKGLSLSAIASNANFQAADFRAKLGTFMKHAPNRFVFARMLMAGLPWPWKIALDEFLDEPELTRMQRVHDLGTLDADVTSMLQQLHKNPAVADAFTYKGVPIGPTIEYDAMIGILDRAFGVFEDQLLAQEYDI